MFFVSELIEKIVVRTSKSEILVAGDLLFFNIDEKSM